MTMKGTSLNSVNNIHYLINMHILCNCSNKHLQTATGFTCRLAQTLSSKYTFILQIRLSIKVKNIISWSNLTVERRKTDYFSSLFSYSSEINVGFEEKKFILQAVKSIGYQVTI